jgi:hypothetical protein
MTTMLAAPWWPNPMASKLVVETEKVGPHLSSWRPFAPGTQDAVLSRTRSPLVGANAISVPTPT